MEKVAQNEREPQACPDCQHDVERHGGSGCLVRAKRPTPLTSDRGVVSPQYEYCGCMNTTEGLEAYFALAEVPRC